MSCCTVTDGIHQSIVLWLNEICLLLKLNLELPESKKIRNILIYYQGCNTAIQTILNQYQILTAVFVLVVIQLTFWTILNFGNVIDFIMHCIFIQVLTWWTYWIWYWVFILLKFCQSFLELNKWQLSKHRLVDYEYFLRFMSGSSHIRHVLKLEIVIELFLLFSNWK